MRLLWDWSADVRLWAFLIRGSVDGVALPALEDAEVRTRSEERGSSGSREGCWTTLWRGENLGLKESAETELGLRR